MADAGGPMNTRPASTTGLRKLFVLAQKTIAGVDGLRPGGLGRRNDVFPAQVAVFGRAATDIDGLVARADMLGVGIGIGIDRHCFDGHARAVAATRQAISPRLAIRILLNMVCLSGGILGKTECRWCTGVGHATEDAGQAGKQGAQ